MAKKKAAKPAARKLEKPASRAKAVTPTRSSPGESPPIAALTKADQTKIRKLLRLKTAEGVTLGLSLLESLGATTADYEAVFTETVIKSVLNGWVAESWGAVAKALVPHGAVSVLFQRLAEEKFLKRPKTYWAFSGLRAVADGVSQGLLRIRSAGVTTAGYDGVSTAVMETVAAGVAHEWLLGGEAARIEYEQYHGMVVRPAFLRIWRGASRPLKPFINLVNVPAGSFTMGSHANTLNIVDVRITKRFEIGQTMITQGQWRSVMGTEPWRYEGLKEDQHGDDFPAVYVRWLDAMLFCNKITSLERETGQLTTTQYYRLPTEAEWEYACRAGTTTAYSFGDDPEKLSDYAWYYKNSAGRLQPVARKKPNQWGLYDMHGNGGEWCSDWYAERLQGGDDPQGPSLEEVTSIEVSRQGLLDRGDVMLMRVSRGASWDYDSSFHVSAMRDHGYPDRPYLAAGFRVVLVR